MITIKQTYTRIEDGHGVVTVVFVVSDKHIGLFGNDAGSIDTSALTGDYTSGYLANGAAITAISKAAECVVTLAGHGFANGDIIKITGTFNASWNAVLQDQYFVVGDVATDTFSISNGDVSVDIFTVGDVEEKLSDKIGGMVTSSLSFEINEGNIKTATEAGALAFVVAGLDPAVFRYCGLFFDPVATTRAQSEARFLGVIQPNIDDDALYWKSAPWASTTGGVHNRKITAAPLYRDFFDSIMLKDLILGSEDETVPGIDAAWIAANVADRQGWFSRNNTDHKGAYNDHTMVYQLVNFNAVLRKLADNLITSLTNKDLGTYQIVFDRSELDGQWLPARWNHYQKTGEGSPHYPRFVSWTGTNGPAFNKYAADAQTLVIDPDGNAPVFIGTGLNDLAFSGEYTGKTRTTFKIEIDSAGAQDTFKWSSDGTNWNAGVTITGSAQLLSDGVSVTFAAITGHSIADFWEITPPTKYESIWINFNTVKYNSALEPTPSEAKELCFSEMDDISFIEFIAGVALNYGMFAKIYYSDSSTLHIKFINRATFATVQCFVRDVEKCSRKLTGEITDNEKYTAVANYLSIEGTYWAGGSDFLSDPRLSDEFVVYSNYCKTRNDSGGIEYKKFNYKAANKNRLWFTISPTMANLTDSLSKSPYHAYDVSDDKGAWCTMPYFPHGHYAEETRIVTGTRKKTKDFFLDLYGLHTAIYMYVDMRTDKTLNDTYNMESEHYWTPAASLVTLIDGVEKEFLRLSDYINYINGRESGYFQSEINLDIPLWQGFSSNSDGSNSGWSHLGLGKVLNLDGLNYTITSIKFKGDTPSTTLVLQGSGRFSGVSVPVAPLIQQPDIIPTPVSSLPVASGDTIYTLNVVKRNADGTVSKAAHTAGEHGSIVGISLCDAAAGAGVTLVTGGIIENQEWEDILNTTITPGDALTLQTPNTGIRNIGLNGKLVSGELYCRVGIFETKTLLRIDIQEILVD